MKNPASAPDFSHIFQHFLDSKDRLRVIPVASCDLEGNPNLAHKLLIDVIAPNRIFFLDYRYNRTYSNLQKNPRLSISFVDEMAFQGYRLTGVCQPLQKEEELKKARLVWEKRVERYVVDRIIDRIRGHSSARGAEEALPQDYVIMEFLAKEAALVKPDRALMAQHHFFEHPEGLQGPLE